MTDHKRNYTTEYFVRFNEKQADEYINAMRDSLPDEITVPDAVIAAFSVALDIAKAGGVSAPAALGIMAGAMVGFYGKAGLEALSNVSTVAVAMTPILAKQGLVPDGETELN